MMKLKLMLVAMLTLAAAAVSARAQAPLPPGRSLGDGTLQDALRERDPVKRDELLIAGANRRNNRMEGEAKARQFATVSTFQARVAVTNHSTKTIRAVSWSASLTDPGTGAVIRTYDVTTRARIAPGKTKKLSKRLRTPRADVVNAAGPPRPRSPAVADLKIEVTGVTYEDGSTSTTP